MDDGSAALQAAEICHGDLCAANSMQDICHTGPDSVLTRTVSKLSVPSHSPDSAPHTGKNPPIAPAPACQPAVSDTALYDPAMEKLTLLTLALLIAPVSAGGQAQIPPDFELARDAVERGEILPLAEVLSRLQESHPGRVIEVELEYSENILVYEVELVTDDGRLIEVEMNAATGAFIKMDEED
jgi:hypothetical protein